MRCFLFAHRYLLESCQRFIVLEHLRKCNRALVTNLAIAETMWTGEYGVRFPGR